MGCRWEVVKRSGAGYVPGRIHRSKEHRMRRDDDDDDEEFEEEEEAPRGVGAGSFAAGLALGALVGATVALLFAPATGKVTRKKLKRHLDDAKELAEDQIDELTRKARREIKKHVS